MGKSAFYSACKLVWWKKIEKDINVTVKEKVLQSVGYFFFQGVFFIIKLR